MADTNGTDTKALPSRSTPATPPAGVEAYPSDPPRGGKGGGVPGGEGLPRDVGRDGKALPQVTQVGVDIDHRRMLEQFADWYYPERRPTSDELVHEMVGIAYRRAARDMQRAETAEDRIARLGEG